MSTLILDSIRETIVVTLRKPDAQVFYNLIRRILIDKESIVKDNNGNNINMQINDLRGEINSIEELKKFNNNGWEQK